MESEVEVTEEEKDGILFLALKGRLDAVSAPKTEKHVADLIDSGKLKIIMNFEGIDYLSSAGMRMLLATTKKLKALSGKFIVCGVITSVLDVLKMSGFDHVIELTDNADEAVKKFN